MSERKQRIKRAIVDIRAGRMVILVDDEDRENEGDLCMAAELVTPEAINFMATHGRGLICLTITDPLIERLQLPMMVPENGSRMGTAFTVSVEAREGVTTGISAADRAHTILTAVADGARAEDLVRPGHVFPLRARPGGVLVRTGQTEGSVDLARIAGLKSAGVICEIMNADGTMSRMPDLERFAQEHDLVIVSVADLIVYRLADETLVEVVRDAEIPLAELGTWRTVVFSNAIDRLEHVAFVKGDVCVDEPVLVRVHTACVFGDVFRSAACDCGQQLEYSMKAVAEAGRGVVLYLHRDLRPLTWLVDHHVLGRSVGEDLRPEATGQPGMPTTLRDFGIGAQILRELGLVKIRILTNNPKKIKGLEGYGLVVTERLPLEVATTEDNVRYLANRVQDGNLLNRVGDGSS